MNPRLQIAPALYAILFLVYIDAMTAFINICYVMHAVFPLTFPSCSIVFKDSMDTILNVPT
jgi:hypothetical protein